MHVDHTIRALEKLNLSSGRATAVQRAALMKLDIKHMLVRSELVVDVFFAFVAESDPEFQAADFNQAVKLSFELCPEDLFEYCLRELPFGCQAWNRYCRDFWIPIMNSFGLGEENTPARVQRRRPMSSAPKIGHLREAAIIRVDSWMAMLYARRMVCRSIGGSSPADFATSCSVSNPVAAILTLNWHNESESIPQPVPSKLVLTNGVASNGAKTVFYFNQKRDHLCLN